MVSVSQLPVCIYVDIYMLYINLFCSVQLGGESYVIAPNGVHRARTAHPFPP